MPEPLDRSTVDRLAKLSERALCADSGRSGGGDRAAGFDPKRPMITRGVIGGSWPKAVAVQAEREISSVGGRSGRPIWRQAVRSLEKCLVDPWVKI